MNLSVTHIEPCAGIIQIWPVQLLLQAKYADIKLQRLPSILNNHADVVDCGNYALWQSSSSVWVILCAAHGIALAPAKSLEI